MSALLKQQQQQSLYPICRATHRGYNIYGIINSSWLTSIGLHHDVLMPSARQIIDSPSLLVSSSSIFSFLFSCAADCCLGFQQQRRYRPAGHNKQTAVLSGPLALQWVGVSLRTRNTHRDRERERKKVYSSIYIERSGLV